VVQTREIRSVADLGGEAAGVLMTAVRDMHAGIASRVFGAIGPAAKPTQIIHDAAARTIYGGVDGGIRGATRVAGALASKAWGRDGDESLESQPTIAAAIAAINGLYGDQLTAHRNGFALSMQIRHHGTAVPLTDDGVAAAFPTATGRLALFVHGLFLSERSWWRTPRTGEDLRSYGQRLHHEHGFTPVYLRYNTGLHISHNGQTLADMLHRLEALWPVPIHEIVLVGHSMGGLVTRSACYYGEQQQHRWTEAVRHVVCLGSPHLGTHLEKGVHIASWALARLPETRAVAGFLNARSAGIKDLRFGACIEDDWRDCDPDEFLQDRCQEVPFLPGAGYHFVATTAAPPAVGRLVGDHLVRSHSACGRGNTRRIPFQPEHGLTLRGLHHFDLLNHPTIYTKLREWVTHHRYSPAATRDQGLGQSS
jgi:pimeloyl-ACP methyl ester carboxylesterase